MITKLIHFILLGIEDALVFLAGKTGMSIGFVLIFLIVLWFWWKPIVTLIKGGLKRAGL